MDQRPYKRKIKLIKRKFQFQIIAYMFLITLALLSVHALVLTLLISKREILAHEGGPDIAYWISGINLVFTVLVVGLVQVVLGIHFTHKFAGPLYKFEQTLGRMGQGDLSDRLKLRKGDMLMDFCDRMNEALNGLRGLCAEDRKALDEAGLALLDLEAKAGSDPEAKRAVESVQKNLRAVRARFTVDRPPPSAAPADVEAPAATSR